MSSASDSPCRAPNGWATGGIPLLVFADDWGRHPSSCQHLIRRLQAHHPILWVNSIGTRKIKTDGMTFRRVLEKLRNWSRGVRQVGDQMWVVDLPMVPSLASRTLRDFNRRLVTWRLGRILQRLRLSEPILLTNLPYVDWLIRDLPRRGSVYYCTDDYSYWPSADRETLQQADREFTGRADLILAVSRALADQHDVDGRCLFFPHGVDRQHFATAGSFTATLPADLASLPGPRIGFFGLIYEKLDFELLTLLASRFPTASLVLIGSTVWCPESFASLPNVHLIGQRPYEQLPRYIAGLDVLLLPYKADDPMIRRSGPLKLRECLASGRPTVSVDVPEVRVLEPHVRVARDPEAFVAMVSEALLESPGSPDAEARVRAVQADDWDSRAEQLQTLLAERFPAVTKPISCRSLAG